MRVEIVANARCDLCDGELAAGYWERGLFEIYLFGFEYHWDVCDACAQPMILAILATGKERGRPLEPTHPIRLRLPKGHPERPARPARGKARR
jgi:hypothetical protein